MAIDVLFIGAHPDDVEWGVGGMALLLKRANMRFAIADLTDGEMGSRGTPEERRREAQEAARFAGAVARESLSLPDCGLVDSPESRMKIAGLIRRYRPGIVLAPYWKDRHPDHAAAGLMVRNSALYCTLKKLNDPHPPHKPAAFLYYVLHGQVRPSFVVDVSTVYQEKLELLRLHRTQFGKTAEEYGLIPAGLGNYLFGLESRDRYFGSLVGAYHGEAIVIDRPVRIDVISNLLGMVLAGQRGTTQSNSEPRQNAADHYAAPGAAP